MLDSPELTYAAYKHLESERNRAAGRRPKPRTHDYTGLWPDEQTHSWASDWSDSRTSERSGGATGLARGLFLIFLGSSFGDSDDFGDFGF